MAPSAMASLRVLSLLLNVPRKGGSGFALGVG